MNKILESTKFVVDNSNYVKINQDKIDEFCNSFNHKHIKHWVNEAPFSLKELNNKNRLHFLLVFNSISFSYWGDPKWTIEYKGNKYDGAYGMIATLGKALDNGFSILDPKYLANITKEDFSKILEGNVQIPLFEDRLKIIREVGQVLTDKFDGDFSNLIKKTNDVNKLLDLIIKNFPSFEDESTYKGKRIYFYKRAQLLISDIYQAFNGKGLGKMNDIQELTACADYKLPLVFRRLGIFSYLDSLARDIDNQTEIDKDSEEEIEIRANTIWVVELIKDKLRNTISDINSIHVNDYIWLLGQEKIKNDKPYHLTRTTAY